MGANEIEALGRLNPSWWSLVVAALVLAPLLVPLFRREREKPHDPLPAIMQEIAELKRRTAENEKRMDKSDDDRHDIRRDLERVERRQDLYQAIRNMGRRDE
nr:hypothetical protein [Paracoccus saliphilus]